MDDIGVSWAIMCWGKPSFISGDITIILASHIYNTDGKTSSYLKEKRNRQKFIHFTHG